MPENLKSFLASYQGKAAAAVVVCLFLLLLVVPAAISYTAESRLKATTEEINSKLKTVPVRFELTSFKPGLFGADAMHDAVSPCPPNENLFKLSHRITPFPYAGLAWARIETRVELPSEAPQQLRDILSGNKPFIATTKMGWSGLSGHFVLPAREIREDDVLVKLGELGGEWTLAEESRLVMNLAQLGAGRGEEGATLKDISFKTSARASVVKELMEGEGSLTIKSLETSGPVRLETGGLVIATVTKVNAEHAQAEVSFQVDHFRVKQESDALQFSKAILGFEISSLDVQALLAYQKEVEAIDQCLPPPQHMQLVLVALKKLLDAHVVSGVKGGIKQASVTFPDGGVSLRADVALAPEKAANSQPVQARLSGQLSMTMGRKVAVKLLGQTAGMPAEIAGEQINELLQDRTLVASGDNLSAVLTFNQSGAQLNGQDIGTFDTLMQRFGPAEEEMPEMAPEEYELPSPEEVAAPAAH